MQVLQRSFSILLAVFFVMFAVALVFQEKENNGYTQWEEIQVNRFLQQISREGRCTYEEYQLFYKALNQFGVNAEIVLKEYQRETDSKGTVYWYLVSWEEIKELLIQKEQYVFQKNSALELCITTKKGDSVTQEKYYSIAKGQESVSSKVWTK